jgi:cation diffusion facilitator CzcD-associated flavoprotein CzcO
VKVRKPNGAIFEQQCDFLINGAGILNAWRWPDIAGLDSFQGTLVHTAQWDAAIDVEGKKVGIIGNGWV